MKIYTRTGDSGETSLFGGARVKKDTPRVEAYGEVDELNASLGAARTLGLPPEVDEVVVAVQRDLLALGALLSDPSGTISTRLPKATIRDEDVARLEDAIDRFELELPPLQNFIVPGGTPAGAALHVARTICRRAERRIVAVSPPVRPIQLHYVNRLSDLLFVAARFVNHRGGAVETEW